MKVRTQALGVLLMSLGLPACGKTSEAAPKAEPSATAAAPSATPRGRAKVRVEIATIGDSRATLDLNVPGEIKGSRDAQLAAPAGGQVERVFVEEGDSVKKGQTLAIIDGSVRGVQLEQIRAELEQAERESERAQALADISTQAERERAATQVRLLEAKLKLAKLEVSRATIRAPFSGVVANVTVEPGEVVGPASPVVRVVQLDTVEIDLSVPDRDVVAMGVGTEVTIGVGARAGLATGEITRVLPAGNLETRAFTAKVEADNPDHKLLPGMIANVRVRKVLSKDAVVIPQDWLVTGLDELGVFVDEDGVARWRKIKAEEIVRDQVVVASGIKRGDRVVVVGQRQLADGDPLIVAREGTCCEDGRAVFAAAAEE